MEIDGTCLCGDIAYEATIDPNKIGICHCTDCQINSATAFRVAVMVPAEDFRLLTGELKAYVKTAESGNRRAISFCPRCGTSIHGSAADKPTSYSLRVGTARQRHDLKPRMQIWHRSALPWLDEMDEMKVLETGRPA